MIRYRESVRPVDLASKAGLAMPFVFQAKGEPGNHGRAQQQASL
jgi:hypothetical protein